MFYRKMYAYGFVYIAFVIVSSIITTMMNASESVDRSITMALAITLGFSGNGLYKHFIDKKIKSKVMSITQAQEIGGTNPIAAWSLFLLIVALVAFGIFFEG